MSATDKQPHVDTLQHPQQPIGWAEEGVVRFKGNAIVRALLDRCGADGYDLNQICVGAQDGTYPAEDYAQLMQLLGYSVDGYCDLFMVPDEAKNRAHALAQVVVRGGIRNIGDMTGILSRLDPDNLSEENARTFNLLRMLGRYMAALVRTPDNTKLIAMATMAMGEDFSAKGARLLAETFRNVASFHRTQGAFAEQIAALADGIEADEGGES